jgi:hypothetical protein
MQFPTIKEGTMTPNLRRLCLLSLVIGTCAADEVTLPNNAVMRADRSLVSIKAGTVVEVVQRGDKTVSIRYKGQEGTIPASSLAAAPNAIAAPAAPAPKAPTPAAKPTSPASGSLVVDHPQSFYGNIVKKAETNIAKHDENLVKPANATTSDNPSN